MIRRLLQIVAVFTVLASIVSAQCAFACTPQADVHACCKHHTKTSDCNEAGTHSNAASLDVHRVAVPLLATQTLTPVMADIRFISATPPSAVLQLRPPLITSLRI